MVDYHISPVTGPSFVNDADNIAALLADSIKVYSIQRTSKEEKAN
jgi:hypothetical protein